MRRAAMLEAGLQPRGRETARLDGWAIRVDLRGVPIVEPAFASIAPEEASTVFGVVWWITQQEAERLDHFEARTYDVIQVDVVASSSGPLRARAYRGRIPAPELRPSRRYLRLLVEGAREAGLPDDYVRALERVPVAHVPVLSELTTLTWKCYLATRGWLAQRRLQREGMGE
jgi:hypothetical protein